MVFYHFDSSDIYKASADLSGAGLLAIDLLDIGSSAVGLSADSLAVDLLDVGLSAVDSSIYLIVDPASLSLL